MSLNILSPKHFCFAKTVNGYGLLSIFTKKLNKFKISSQILNKFWSILNSFPTKFWSNLLLARSLDIILKLCIGIVCLLPKQFIRKCVLKTDSTVFKNFQSLKILALFTGLITDFMLRLLLYPLKIAENLWFSDVFRGYRKRQWYVMG